MAMPTGATISTEAIKERFVPAVEKFDEAMRKGRKAFVRGQHTAEDAAALAALGIRRRPIMSVVTALAVGALVGALAGFGLGRAARCGE
jgi:hypothetical protein